MWKIFEKIKNTKLQLAKIGASIVFIGAVIAIFANLFSLKDRLFNADEKTEKTVNNFKTNSYKSCKEGFYTKHSEYIKNLNKGELFTNPEPILLQDFYFKTIPELEILNNSIKSNKVFSPDSLIFITGGGGVGKTPVVKYKLAQNHNTLFFDLAIFRYKPVSDEIHPDTYLEEDIVVANQVVSSLPRLYDSIIDNDFVEILKRYCDFQIDTVNTIIIDAIDEISTTSATCLLNKAYEYVVNHNINIIISGRGEGFRGFIIQDRVPKKFKHFNLNYHYLNDDEILYWYIANYLKYKNGFVTQPKDAVDKTFDKIKSATLKYPHLKEFLVTAEFANFTIDNILDHSDAIENNYDFRKLLFDRLIQRNKRTHNRPSSDMGEKYHIYIELLSQIAKEIKMKDNGTFIITQSDVLTYNYDGKKYRINKSRVLNHSGIIELNPFNSQHLEYCFVPPIIYKYLAE